MFILVELCNCGASLFRNKKYLFVPQNTVKNKKDFWFGVSWLNSALGLDRLVCTEQHFLVTIWHSKESFASGAEGRLLRRVVATANYASEQQKGSVTGKCIPCGQVCSNLLSGSPNIISPWDFSRLLRKETSSTFIKFYFLVIIWDKFCYFT